MLGLLIKPANRFHAVDLNDVDGLSVLTVLSQITHYEKPSFLVEYYQLLKAPGRLKLYFLETLKV